MREGLVKSGISCSTSPEILARSGAFFSEDLGSTGFNLSSFGLALENPPAEACATQIQIRGEAPRFAAQFCELVMT